MNIGDKVKVASGNYSEAIKGKIGVIDRIHNFTFGDVAIVKLDDNVSAKVYTVDLIKIDEAQEAHKEQEYETEIPEGARVISEEDFLGAVFEVTKPENHSGGMDEKNPMSNIIGGMVGVVVGAKIAKKVFKDQEAVTLTEDQLVKIIWDGCSPENMQGVIDNNMTVDVCMVTSLAAIMTLKNLGNILFPNGSENA